jgi:NPCBM/NEW2 domain-containing protein
VTASEKAVGEGDRRASWPRMLIACLIAFALGCAALEIGLRWALFSDSDLARRVGRQLRHPWLYSDRWNDEDYWKLLQRFEGDPGPLPAANVDPALGWKSSQFDGGTYRHARMEGLGDRRPIVLYGDSFAQCNTPSSSCFEGILARSDLRDRYVLLNYGVRAYGLDQVYLLLQRSLDSLLPLRPVVVVGVCVDEDFDRSLLEFRGWPKPLLKLEGGQLVRTSPSVPSLDEYLASHPLGIRSYFWRSLVYGTDLLPDFAREPFTGEAEHLREKQVLNERILEEIEQLLASRGVEHFFLVFHGQPQLGTRGPLDWREQLMLDFLRRWRVPYLSSKAFLHEDSYLEACDFGQYYGVEGQQNAHWTERANRVVFRAFVEGLSGHFERCDELAPVDPRNLQGDVVYKGQVLACFATGLRAPFERPDEQERLCLRVMGGGPTRVRYALGGKCSSFEAIARVPDLERFGRIKEACGSLRVKVSLDGRLIWDQTLRRPVSDLPLQFDLTGAQEMTIEVRSAGDGFECDYIYFASPRFG